MRKEDKQSPQNGGELSAAHQLERIANLLALLLTHGKPQAEQITVLSGAGYSSAEIAQLVGTTRNTVSVTLSQLKAEKQSKSKKARK